MADEQSDTKKTGFSPRIRYQGVFNMEGLLNLIRKFFGDRYYIFTEKNYKYKTPNPFGHEVEMSWFGWRNINEYVRYTITVDFHFWELTTVEVEVEGKKVKLEKGRILIDIGGKVELDYAEKFEKSNFLEKLRKFYHTHVIKSDIFVIYGDRLYYSTYKLNGLIKDFLDMQTKYNAYVNMYQMSQK